MCVYYLSRTINSLKAVCSLCVHVFSYVCVRGPVCLCVCVCKRTCNAHEVCECACAAMHHEPIGVSRQFIMTHTLWIWLEEKARHVGLLMAVQWPKLHVLHVLSARNLCFKRPSILRLHKMYPHENVLLMPFDLTHCHFNC